MLLKQQALLLLGLQLEQYKPYKVPQGVTVKKPIVVCALAVTMLASQALPN
jgi:hypothetical protein